MLPCVRVCVYETMVLIWFIRVVQHILIVDLVFSPEFSQLLKYIEIKMVYIYTSTVILWMLSPTAYSTLQWRQKGA